jgi:hypothetical protein
VLPKADRLILISSEDGVIEREAPVSCFSVDVLNVTIDSTEAMDWPESDNCATVPLCLTLRDAPTSDLLQIRYLRKMP